MIQLHPIPEVALDCPHCSEALTAVDWCIPGVRTLAVLECERCNRRYYGDLPAGGGLYYPMVLDAQTGKVHDSHGVSWFAQWLEKSFAQRSRAPVKLTIEENRPLRRPVLLNCLDTLYGHCLLKLLNAQHYIDQVPDHDLVLLVPQFLRWMVPTGAAAVWTVDWPLRAGIQWNDLLAAEIRGRLARFEEVWLSKAYSHPHPGDFDISRFSGVDPFPLEDWERRLSRPTITFIWRDDRSWPHVEELAEILRREWAGLDFAVAGLAVPRTLPGWITDLRTTDMNDEVERQWCRRYAASHVAIGVHGSNMLLPSAHAGAVIDLMPPDRWRNVIQDVLPRAGDVREEMFRHRMLPLGTPAEEVANVTTAMLLEFEAMRLKMHPENCRHAIGSGTRTGSDKWMASPLS